MSEARTAPDHKKPAIIAVSGGSGTLRSLSDASLQGLAPVLSSLSAAMDLVPHSRDELYRYLHVRIYLSDRAEARGRWLPGRIYNSLSGESGDYITLSGVHLRQTLNMAHLKTPDAVRGDREYLLRKDIARAAYDALKAAGATPLPIG